MESDLHIQASIEEANKKILNGIEERGHLAPNGTVPYTLEGAEVRLSSLHIFEAKDKTRILCIPHRAQIADGKVGTWQIKVKYSVIGRDGILLGDTSWKTCQNTTVNATEVKIHGKLISSPTAFLVLGVPGPAARKFVKAFLYIEKVGQEYCLLKIHFGGPPRMPEGLSPAAEFKIPLPLPDAYKTLSLKAVGRNPGINATADTNQLPSDSFREGAGNIFPYVMLEIKRKKDPDEDKGSTNLDSEKTFAAQQKELNTREIQLIFTADDEPVHSLRFHVDFDGEGKLIKGEEGGSYAPDNSVCKNIQRLKKNLEGIEHHRPAFLQDEQKRMVLSEAVGKFGSTVEPLLAGIVPAHKSYQESENASPSHY